MEDEEKDIKIQDIKNMIVELAREWMHVQKEIGDLSKPAVTDGDIQKRQDIGEKIIRIKRHLEEEVKKLEEEEKAPNLMDRWNKENDED